MQPIALVGLLLAATGAPAADSGPVAPGPPQSPRRVEVYGHRGARALRPENTLPGFAYALEVGVDAIELDVHASRDDRLVVAHDQTVNADLCLEPGGKRPAENLALRTLTLQQIQRLDCGSLKNPRFPKQVPAPGARVPTLEEVFELVRSSRLPAAKKLQVDIEVKSVPGRPELSPPPDAFAALVVNAARKSGMFDRLIVQSFDHRVIVAAKRLEPKLRTSALNSENFPDYLAMVRAAGADFLAPHHLWITRDSVQALHAAKVRVLPWTANTAAEWQALIDQGVDGIITDDPAALIEYLNRGR